MKRITGYTFGLLCLTFSLAKSADITINRALNSKDNEILLEWEYSSPILDFSHVVIEHSNDKFGVFEPIDTFSINATECLIKGINTSKENFFLVRGLASAAASEIARTGSRGKFTQHYQARPDTIYASNPILFGLNDQVFYGVPGTTNTEFYRYDIHMRNWQQVSSLNATIGTGGSFVQGDTYYHITLTTLYQYSATNDLWSEASFTDGPKENRTRPKASNLEGTVYYGFGYKNYQAQHDLWQYDLNLNQWDSIANFGPDMSDEACRYMFNHNNLLYFVARANGSFKTYLHTFNTVTKEFIYKADSLPSSTYISSPVYFTIGDSFYYYFAATPSAVDEALWQYDLNENRWMNIQRAYNRYYDLGLATESFGILIQNSSFGDDEIYIFDPADPYTTKTFLALEHHSSTDLTLNWEVSEPGSYEHVVEYRQGQYDPYAALDTVSTGSFSFTMDEPNITHCFRVRSIGTNDTLVSNTAYVNSGPNWIEKSTMPWFHQEFSDNLAHCNIGRTTYFFQGDAFDLTPAKLWKYDSEKDKWDRAANFPGVQRSQPVFFSIGDKAYLVSGDVSVADSVLQDVWEYDPSEDQWAQLKDFPGSERRAGMSFSNLGKGYVGLGYASESSEELTDLWEYDPLLDSWTQQAPFPGNPLELPSSMRLNDSIFYVGFGFDRVTHSNNSKVWTYDTKNDTWNLTAYHHSPGYLKGVSLDKQLFALNMQNWSQGSNYFRFRNLTRFVPGPGTDYWSHLGSYPGDGDPVVAFSTDKALFFIQENGEMWSYVPIPLPHKNFVATSVPVASAKVEWDAEPNTPGDSLFVERSVGTNQSYLPLTKLSGIATSFIDTLLTPGEMYYYRMNARNAFGATPYVETSLQIPEIPEGPSDLKVVDNGLGSIALTWNNNADQYDSILIERSINSSDYETVTALVGDAREYLDYLSFYQYDVPYAYRAKARTVSGFTEYSNTASITLIITNLPESGTAGIRIWPNPASSGLTIDLGNDSTYAAATLFAISGEEILHLPVSTHRTKLDLTGLNKGVYILKVSGTKHTGTYKVLKK